MTVFMTTLFRARAISFLALVAASIATPAAAQSRPAPISEAEVRAHIAVLASDDFEGRAPGTAGETKTLDYLAKTWASYGLTSGTNDAATPWFQPVPLVERKPFAQTVQAFAGSRRIAIDTDAILLSGRNATDSVNADLVYVGYGVNADGNVNADVAGKIAVMLFADPKFDGLETPPGRREREKLLAEAGARAVLIVAPKAAPWGQIRTQATSGAMRLVKDDVGAPIAGLLREDALAALLKPARLSLEAAAKLAENPGFAGRALSVRMDLVTSTIVRSFASHNVIAKLAGSKPDAGAIVLLGHWDHFGICRGEEAEDRICNGAVDNASGMAVLLTVAQRLARAKAAGVQLDRDVYFMGTTAEERGLLGAYHYADKPNVPLDQILVALNVDTVAIAKKGAPVAIIGRGETDLDPQIEAVATSIGRSIEPSKDANAFIRRQDGWALAAKGVKSLMVGGSFADLALLQAFLSTAYHQPDDELTDATELGGATEDANLHVALVQHFADTAKYTPAPTGD